MEVGLKQEVTLELRGDGTVSNLTVCVAAYTATGDGPWSLPVPLEPWHPGNSKATLSPLNLPTRTSSLPGAPDLLPEPFRVTPCQALFLPGAFLRASLPHPATASLPFLSMSSLCPFSSQDKDSQSTSWVRALTPPPLLPFPQPRGKTPSPHNHMLFAHPFCVSQTHHSVLECGP